VCVCVYVCACVSNSFGTSVPHSVILLWGLVAGISLLGLQKTLRTKNASIVMDSVFGVSASSGE